MTMKMNWDCSRLRFLALIFGVFFHAVSIAATIRVPANFVSIQLALDAAADGDTVLVGPGTYQESLTINKNVTLASEEGPEVTIIDGNWANQTLLISNGPTIDGFTLLNTPPPQATSSENKRIIYGAGASPVISNNVFAFKSDNQVGCYAEAIRLHPTEYDHVQILNNKIIGRDHPTLNFNQCGVGIRIWHAGGNVRIIGNRIERVISGGISLSTTSPSTAEIYSNILFNNSGGIDVGIRAQATVDVVNNSITGLDDGYSGFSWGDYNYTSSTHGGLRLLNNTIAHNAGRGDVYSKSTEVEIAYSKSPVLIQNNIIAARGDNAAAFKCEGHGAGDNAPIPIPEVLSNIFYIESRYTQNFLGCQHGPIDYQGGSYNLADYDIRGKDGNISEYPLFVNPGIGDFRLAESSPAIDAGRLLPILPPESDVLGHERILSGVIDMGAYEFDPINSPPPSSAVSQEFSSFSGAKLTFGHGRKGATPLSFSAYFSVYTAEGFNLDHDPLEMKIEDASGILYQLNAPAGGFKFKAKKSVIGWGLKTPKLAIVSDVNDPKAHNAFAGYIQLEDKKFKLPRMPDGQIRLTLQFGGNYGVLEMSCLNIGSSLECASVP